MKLCQVHIPKTGGVYLNQKLTWPLTQYCGAELKRNNAHEAWSLIDDDTYIISSVREPIKRIISHYCHFQESLDDTLEINVKNFRTWYEENVLYLQNYQAKNFFVTDDLSQWRNALIPEQIFIDCVVDENIVLNNVKKINVLLRDNQLTDQHLFKVKDKIISELNLIHNYLPKNIPPDYNSREISKQIYNQLTLDDETRIKKDNELDYEIYLNDSYYWNYGQ